MRYDLIILGNDRHGRLAALEAAKLCQSVALVEADEEDSLPRAAVREAALLLTGVCHEEGLRREVRSAQPSVWRTAREIAERSANDWDSRLESPGVDRFLGRAIFLNPHEIDVRPLTGERLRLHGDRYLLALGSIPARPSWVPFDGVTILDRGESLKLGRIPKSMIVVGADADALETALLFAVLGTRVAVVDARRKLLGLFDQEIVERFRRRAEQLGVHFRLGRPVEAIERTPDCRAVVRMQGGRTLKASCVLYAADRRGNTDGLKLGAAEIEPDERGCLWCNERGQTWVDHISAVGEVVGFPPLAAVGLDESRRVICRMFGRESECSLPRAFGLLTIPELAFVGATEEQLQDDLTAYEVGVSRFAEPSRGRLGGSPRGMLKLLFHRESLEVLGVHCLSESATELIRIGQTVMSLGGTIEAFRDHTFHDAPMSECYRLAAEDGFARLEDSLTRTRPTRSQRGAKKLLVRHQRLALSPR